MGIVVICWKANILTTEYFRSDIDASHLIASYVNKMKESCTKIIVAEIKQYWTQEWVDKNLTEIK